MQEPFPADFQRIARAIAAEFAKLDMVEAITLGGSLATGRANAGSDIDLYIYYSEPIPLGLTLLSHARARWNLMLGIGEPMITGLKKKVAF